MYFSILMHRLARLLETAHQPDENRTNRKCTFQITFTTLHSPSLADRTAGAAMTRQQPTQAWLATTARHEDTIDGQTEELFLLRELPAKLTERQAEVKHTEAKESSSLLQALRSGTDESSESLQHRLQVMHDAWGASERGFQVSACKKQRAGELN